MANSDFIPARPVGKTPGYAVARTAQVRDDPKRRPSWPGKPGTGEAARGGTGFRAALDAARSATDCFDPSRDTRKPFDVTVVCALLAPMESESPDGAEAAAIEYLNARKAALRGLGLRVEKIFAEERPREE